MDPRLKGQKAAMRAPLTVSGQRLYTPVKANSRGEYVDTGQIVMFKSVRMENVQSPIIPVVGELIRANPGTISLGQGVVSYPPPGEATE